MTTAHLEELAPAERVVRQLRLRQLARGEVRIPLACPHCYGTSLDAESKGVVACVSCGRRSREKQVHTTRRQRIARFIRTGDR